MTCQRVVKFGESPRKCRDLGNRCQITFTSHLTISRGSFDGFFSISGSFRIIFECYLRKW